jgi:hypothetical protein
MAISTTDDLTLNEAQSLYRKFAGVVIGDAARVMGQIAQFAKHQHIEGARLWLLSLREIGRFLIRHNRGPGRSAKSSAVEDLQTLAGSGIAVDAYLGQETEPTLKGLLRFAGEYRVIFTESEFAGITLNHRKLKGDAHAADLVAGIAAALEKKR